MAVEVLPALGRYDDFFEVVGVKKPGGGGCWCMAYRDSRVPNDARGAYMRDECATAPGPGVLAFVDGVVAGWCSVAPRSTYRRLMRSRTIPFVDERDPWSIVCFVVRPAFRRRGLMHELLEGAVAHAATNGAEVVEGYPVEIDGGDRVELGSGYVGTARLFESAGFTRAAATTGHSGGRPRVVMRKELSSGR
ncbi:GNAT family N-acetyltransferase [Cellulomonas fengjieae]|uniref:GNAT family N-acetyltransferase n=1 Tax=Cellulomonas fengjieae TaxID=2819978 RepID=A0ABS3SC42_9CELL|nr:GNAT family N-acetyltransferase [Cellulomonas fengjieae]MBO3083323.1 GNAT family N-acetyltransferase [Cellulomonas fengjieae]QVI65329.1 GNAT family N-acetyltransferase [Cellulomonas fengjieae]